MLESTVSDKTKRDFIVEEICEPIRDYFMNVFKIKRNPAGTNEPNGGSCWGGNTYPAFNYPN